MCKATHVIQDRLEGEKKRPAFGAPSTAVAFAGVVMHLQCVPGCVWMPRS